MQRCLLLVLVSLATTLAFSLSSLTDPVANFFDFGSSSSSAALVTAVPESKGVFSATGFPVFASTKANCPIVKVHPSNFQGKVAEVNSNFVAHINKINEYAKECGVHLYITSSFRKTDHVGGSIVPPATKSNHMVGHAIDMNVVYSGGFCNSNCLEGHLPEPVAKFIEKIKHDGTLRWGGDFTPKDVVHIDDGLNIHNAAEWDREYVEAQKYC